jgi:gamma-glutamyltranspeptidase/glutathione hydrolase
MIPAYRRPSASIGGSFLQRMRTTLLIAVALAAGGAQGQLRPSQPEPPSGWTEKKLVTAKKQMVAAAHPLAVDAGLKILDMGGNAMDAAIAVQLVLGLVEPQASGLGGGAFLLFHDAKKKSLSAFDGRETAPEAATDQLFMKPDGKPMAFNDAVVGGRSVGVPGTPRLLEVAHARHGKLAWAKLFAPAIALAEKGFPITPRVYKLLGDDKFLPTQPVARAYFYEGDGKPRPVGTILKNPEYAATLRAIAAKGADAFYAGDIAKDIVATVRNHASNPGVMSEADLAGYRVRDVEALCGNYRKWQVCGMPPSSSGGIAVLQVLGVLSAFDMAGMRPGSAESVHLIAEAERLAFADRNKWVADDRYVDVPVKGLVDPAYLAARAKLIQPQKSMGKAEAGAPAGAKVSWADDPVDEVAGTSHIAIVDREGNAVSMTTTIEGFFGSKLMVRGFLLNNELTDFNFLPVENGMPVANRVAGGKRPRSSMAPALVFDPKGRLEMVVGSPGGSLIINYVAKALVATLDWNLDVQSAINLGNMGSRNGPTELEKGSALEQVAPALKAMGHDVREIDMTSGLQGIRRTAHGWQGGADPRREGVARGR